VHFFLRNIFNPIPRLELYGMKMASHNLCLVKYPSWVCNSKVQRHSEREKKGKVVEHVDCRLNSRFNFIVGVLRTEINIKIKDKFDLKLPISFARNIHVWNGVKKKCEMLCSYSESHLNLRWISWKGKVIKWNYVFCRLYHHLNFFSCCFILLSILHLCARECLNGDLLFRYTQHTSSWKRRVLRVLSWSRKGKRRELNCIFHSILCFFFVFFNVPQL
jgi:hypothetical protein